MKELCLDPHLLHHIPDSNTSRWLSPLWNDSRLSITPHAPRDIPFGIFPQQNVWGAKESISFPPLIVDVSAFKTRKTGARKMSTLCFPKTTPKSCPFYLSGTSKCVLFILPHLLGLLHIILNALILNMDFLSVCSK